MHKKNIAPAVIILLLFSFSGCIEPAYIQQSETPPNLEGFLGFRWITPLSVLDDHMLQTFDVIPDSRYTSYYSLAYKNYYFMERRSSLCKFVFDDHGMIQVNLFFRPEPENAFPDLDYLLEKLTEVYGRPAKMTNTAFEKEYVGYIEGYYWFGGRLTISLMPGDFIIIRAFAYPKRPPDEQPLPPGPPIYNTREKPPVAYFYEHQGK